MFQSGEIIWCSVGVVFPNVLYLSPVLNTYLQELSEKVYKELLKTADVKVHKCYRPMQWVPHATIGKKLSKEEMLAAFQVLQEQFGVFSSRVVRIGLQKQIHMKSCGILNYENSKKQFTRIVQTEV